MPETQEITQQTVVKKAKLHVPKFIRDFSKENSQEERNLRAQEIREKRAEYFTRKRRLSDQKQEVSGKKDAVQELKEEKDKERKDLFETITELSDKWPMRTLRMMKLKKMREELRDDDMEFMRILRELGDLKREEDYISQQLEIKGVNAELGEARELLEKFYEGQKDVWNKTPYDLAEMQRLLTPEHLSSLSMEDYVALLKRFPSYMVTHVTRQGVRDHFGHAWHTGGIGEYTNGFKEILTEGKISSVVGAALKDGMTQEALGRLFGLDKYKTKKEALEGLKRYMNSRDGGGGYLDASSVHTAVEWVADFYYGGESGNEIFFTFPSAFIGANYYTKGNLYHKSTHDGSNDTWIWTEPDKGLPVNAGITFIPEAAQVDPRTGSRYELDENLKPVIDTERITGLKNLLYNVDFIKALKQVSEIQQSVPYGYQRNSALENQVHAMRDQFGIEDLPLLRGIVFGNTSTGSAALISAANFEMEDKDEVEMGYYVKRGGIETPIKTFLQQLQLLYKLTPNPITSKEYWEEFFSKNPKMKPNKIAYYDGTPELAFSRWRGNQGLSNFPSLDHEKYSVTDSARVKKGQAELEAVVLSTIDAMF